MKNYVEDRLHSGEYICKNGSPNVVGYRNKLGWIDYLVCEQLVFSHRQTYYNAANFPDQLHSHDFYELVVFVAGDIEYVNENNIIAAETGSIVFTTPSRLHTARLIRETDYNRYVLYFNPEAFSFFEGTALLNFLKDTGRDRCFISLREENIDPMFELLHKTEEALESESADCRILAYSYLLQLFVLITQSSPFEVKNEVRMPDNIFRIKKYIDENYKSIRSVSEIAEHFYYSREYVSRLYTQYFNTPITDYVNRRRIIESKRMLSDGCSVTDACYGTGYRNLSSFIKAFKENVGVTPSKYKSKNSESRGIARQTGKQEKLFPESV